MAPKYVATRDCGLPWRCPRAAAPVDAGPTASLDPYPNGVRMLPLSFPSLAESSAVSVLYVFIACIGQIGVNLQIEAQAPEEVVVPTVDGWLHGPLSETYTAETVAVSANHRRTTAPTPDRS